jgi:L-ascorbate metabolism protein UlaG (beta-lactamase superfamily)
MDLVWLGHACFRLRGRTATVVFDPYGPERGKLAANSADVVTISHDHPGHNHVGSVTGQRKVLRGPGEYEIGGVSVTGVQTAHDGSGGRDRGGNTVFVVELDEVVVCHLGDLGHGLTADQVEAIGRVDVLLAPVGSGAGLSTTLLAEVVGQLDPKVIVPMHHRVSAKDGDDEAVAALCRQLGVGVPTAQARLTSTADSLPEERRVVVLEPRRAAEVAAAAKAA